MSNYLKKSIKSIIAFTLAVILGVSCLPTPFEKTADAVSSTVSPSGDGSCYLDGNDTSTWSILKSGNFDISVEVKSYDSTAPSAGFSIEIYECDDSSWDNVVDTWTMDYVLTANGTYAIDESFSYWKKYSGSYDSSNPTTPELSDTKLSLTANNMWGKITPWGCSLVSTTVTEGKIDTIYGMDISSYRSEKNSGVKYYDFDGNELDDAGFFSFLKENGTNWVRIRVWNDPKDSSGNYYGGGNCDLNNAIDLGKLATNAGMRVLIDFHYSDFWCDPGQGRAPKDWSGMSVSEKGTALYNFTYSSLNSLINAGVDVGMVQIGNETNSYFCGITVYPSNNSNNWSDVCSLFKQGINAVKAVETEKSKDILTAVHFTALQDGSTATYIAGQLASNNVDYDIFAASYYQYWHGGLANYMEKLRQVAATYDKKVMIAETAFTYTSTDGDGKANNSGSDYTYPVSIAGQAKGITDVFNGITAINEDNESYGVGMFYWEPAWLPVNYTTTTGSSNIWNLNNAAWGKYGSGWRTSAAASYDSDANENQGTTVDNSALFDFWGSPLESIKTYKNLQNGTSLSGTYVESVDVTEVNFEKGKYIDVPSTVAATLSTGSKVNLSVTWDAQDLRNAFNDEGYEYYNGTAYVYYVRGKVEYNGETTVCVAVLYKWGATVTDISQATTPYQVYTTSPAFAWSDDNSACTATFTSIYDATTVDVDCTVTSSQTVEDATEDNTVLRSSYTATAALKGETYTDTKNIDENVTTYVQINDDIKDYVGDITITAKVFGNSPWSDSYYDLIYYDADQKKDVNLDNVSGPATGEGEITFAVSFENLKKLQNSSYVQIKAAQDSTTYVGFIKSVSVSGLKPYQLYTQKTPVSDGKYSQRWVELIPEEDMNTYAKGTLVITRTNDNKKMTVTLTKCYNSVSAAGEELTAPAGYKYLAYALLNIPEDINLSATEIVLE